MDGLYRSLLWFWPKCLTRCVRPALTGKSSAAYVQHKQNELERRVEVSSNKKRTRAADRRISVRAIRRDPPDIQKLSRALIALALAQAQAEADAQRNHQEKKDEEGRPRAA